MNPMYLNKVVLVGAQASSEALKKFGYGGVLTLSNGLIEYANEIGIDIEVINTIQPADTILPIAKRIKSGVTRVLVLITALFRIRFNGVVIFSGAGWSFYERILMALICRVFQIKCIFFIVDGWFLNIRSKSAFYKFLIGSLLNIPYKLAASGSNWVQLYRELGVNDSKIVTIHYWLPKSFYKSNELKYPKKNERINFIFVGWIIKEKGIYEILASIEILLKSYDFSFTFVGDGSLLETIRDRIKKFNWHSRVFAPGRLTSDQFSFAFLSAHIFVLPSYAEGFPMSLIEAMTNGMPAICTDVGGISESLHNGENGFLIPPKDIGALKNAMEFYILNPEYILNHSANTLEIVKQNHDANTNCQRLFDSFGWNDG